MDFSVVFEELMGSILPEWHSCLFVPFVAKKQGFGKHYLRTPKIASVPHIYKCVRNIPRGTLRTLH